MMFQWHYGLKLDHLEEMGNIELAKIAYSQCIFLTHGRAWDPKGWFWSACERLC